ncbi:MAG: alpha/beta fold hydrolase [Alphaproteobacteria bacterium]|jgi:lysophospholipase|nr:alpha/beta hydrolase [Alphaproteobacteria bacterium]
MKKRWQRGGLLVLACMLGLGAGHADVLPPYFAHMTLESGAKLRIASWKGAPLKHRQTTIVFMQGRASFVEKNKEVMESLAKLGFDVETFDWIGQGGSTRLIANSQKGYIDDFYTYLTSFHEYMQRHVKPRASSKVVLLGVSMGGHLALRYVKEHPGMVDGVILVSPMIDVVTKPYPKVVARFLSAFAHYMGAGKMYAFGYGDYDPKKAVFTLNKETQDPKRFDQMQQTMRAHPHFVTGGPTFGWVYAAYESMDKTNNPAYLATIKEPMLFISAGLDRVVDTQRDRETCALIPHCRYKLYPKAFHNIPLETDEIRDLFLAHVDTFAKSVEEGLS